MRAAPCPSRPCSGGSSRCCTRRCLRREWPKENGGRGSGGHDVTQACPCCVGRGNRGGDAQEALEFESWSHSSLTMRSVNDIGLIPSSVRRPRDRHYAKTVTFSL